MIGNPGLDVVDVTALAQIAREAGLPLVMDATFCTPVLFKPVEHGVNVVIHSLTKWMGGHGVAIGGAVVDAGNFDWGQSDRWPTLTKPFYALDGLVFWEEFGPIALAARIRAEALYNFGPCMSPMTAFLLLQGIETLPLRMERHMQNTAALLDFLKGHEAVAWVRHPSLPDHPDHEVAKRLLPKGAGSIITFGVKGGRAAGQAFIEKVQIASHLANVGDAKTLVIHPASTTHSHISADDMKAGGLSEDMIRLSVGLENIEDLKADFDRALKAAVRAKAVKLLVDGNEIHAATGGRAQWRAGDGSCSCTVSGYSHLTWVLQTRALAYDGWNVLAPDLPGHGLSQGEPPGTVEEMAAFMLAVMDAAGWKRRCSPDIRWAD